MRTTEMILPVRAYQLDLAVFTAPLSSKTTGWFVRGLLLKSQCPTTFADDTPIREYF